MKARCIGLLFALLVFASLSVPLIAASGVNLAAAPISRMDLPWWRRRFEGKAVELRSHAVKLVWYGDSITEDFEHHGPPPWQDFAPIWKHFYGQRDAINLGFVGDSTANLIWRIDHGEADHITPKVAVVLIGANNFGLPHWPARQTVPGIEEVVRLLRNHLPETAIVLLSVLPSKRSAWITRNTRLTNAALAKRYKASRTVHFIDLTGLFMKGGKLNQELFLDRFFSLPEPLLHPTPAAQAMICSAIEPTIAKLMGDQSHHTSH